MTKRFLGLVAVFFIVLFGAFPTVQAQTQLTAGKDFIAIVPPLPTDTPDKIEVVEFFSYACAHCNDLHPLITLWASRLPSDVVFKRVPVTFNNPYYTLMARFYYALEAAGELARLDNAVFDALHRKNLRLVDEKSISEWVGSQNADSKKFSDAFHAFGVDSKVKRADQLAKNARISGVPALVVDGRYQVINSEGFKPFLLLTDKIIEMRRAERKSGKK